MKKSIKLRFIRHGNLFIIKQYDENTDLKNLLVYFKDGRCFGTNELFVSENKDDCIGEIFEYGLDGKCHFNDSIKICKINNKNFVEGDRSLMREILIKSTIDFTEEITSLKKMDEYDSNENFIWNVIKILYGM